MQNRLHRLQLGLYALFAAVLISQRINRPVRTVSRARDKEKVLSSSKLNRNFPTPALFPLREKVDPRRRRDESTRTDRGWLSIPLLDSLSIRSKASSIVLLRPSNADILVFPNRDPFSPFLSLAYTGRRRFFVARKKDFSEKSGGCIDKSDDARPITGLPFTRRVAFRYNSKTAVRSI